MSGREPEHLPVLGIEVGAARDALLASLLTALRRWCLVRYAAPGEPVDAWLIDPGACGPDDLRPQVPTAIWARRPRSHAVRRWRGHAISIVPQAVPATSSQEVLVVPDPAIDVAAVTYVAPLVRRRWRARSGLPETLVIRAGASVGAAVPTRLTATGMAVASAVVAIGDTALESLAWGAPTVTDVATADRLDLHEVTVVADATELESAAAALALDEETGARLSWKGRRHVEIHRDIGTCAARVAEALGLMKPPTTAADNVVERLAELWAPAGVAGAMIGRIVRAESWR